MSSYDQFLKEKKEELIYFKEEHHDALKKFSSGPIQNEVLTLTSYHPSSADHFDIKFQANISSSNQSSEK